MLSTAHSCTGTGMIAKTVRDESPKKNSGWDWKLHILVAARDASFSLAIFKPEGARIKLDGPDALPGLYAAGARE